MLDGGNRMKDLVKTAAAQGMKSLALSDHGNLFGAVEFYKAAQAAGIKPILGMEAYISPTTRQDRSSGNIGDASFHLLLLAMNETGWRNLMKLSSRSYLEGFYYRPRIDRELLSQFHEGLVCTTACLGGEVPTALREDKAARARKIAGEYLDIFGRERFFIEVQNQGEPDQDRVNPMLVELARDLNVRLVGTNDVHFLRRDNKPAHEVLTCIATGKKLADANRLQYSAELYLKSPREMHEALRAWPEAIASTLLISEMCNVNLDFRKHLPVFRPPDGSAPDAYLDRIAREGLRKRFGDRPVPEDYAKRLEWEIEVIRKKGYSSYFLIVHDFVKYARDHQIPAAPRGSGVATLLGYALGIAEVDPLRYGLLFERFTDPARQEDPDMDIDMCQDGREQIIQYVRQKYGHVAQIITYGTLKPKAVIRDVGRVLDWSIEDVTRIANMVPDKPKATFDLALGLVEPKDDDEKALLAPDLRKAYETDPRTHALIDYARDLEGLSRHAGVHAAGVVVCDEPLEQLVPLYRQSDSPEVITQWDGPTCEKAGLMKMDFLGLRTLTILQRSREMVRANTGRDMDPETIPLDDPKVYGLFQRAETDGVFQFESDGMKGVLLKMSPTRIEDLIAANAMYRPGPMELIDDYCDRKAGRKEIDKIHPLVDDILSETYGIMIYQEQVMQVVNRLGQIPLSRALSLIKAISKKKKAVIDAERPAFYQGASANGIAPEESERLFELIMRFAGYGFNKAHSTRYAIVAYQTAWFKVYHPREFFAATLTYECGDTDLVAKYKADAKRMGIEVAPPDINTCAKHFTVDGDRVRYGLKAVKGVGDAAVEAILAARERVGRFEDLFHFCSEVDLRAVNRTAIEALIKCGAFDGCGTAHRAQMIAAVEMAQQAGARKARDRQAGQLSLFGGDAGAEEPPPPFPAVAPWPREEMLAAEFQTLGFYVTAHPLEEYGPEIRGLSYPRGLTLATLKNHGDRTFVAVAGRVSAVRILVAKKGRSAGKQMAVLGFEDVSGKCDAVLFPDDYARLSGRIAADSLYLIRGTLDKSRDTPNVIVNEIVPLDASLEKGVKGILLTVSAAGLQDADRIARLQAILRAHRGGCPVRLRVSTDPALCQAFDMEMGSEWSVKPSHALIRDLRGCLGDANIHLDVEAPERPERRGRYASHE